MLTTVLEIVGAMVGLGGIISGVVYYLRRAAQNSADLNTANASLLAEQKQVAQQDAAAAAQRQARLQEIDAKAAAVHDAAGAAELLNEATGDDPTVN